MKQKEVPEMDASAIPYNLFYKCRGSFIYCPLTLSSIHF